MSNITRALLAVALTVTASSAFAAQSASEDDWTLPSWVTRTANSGFYGGYNAPAGFVNVELLDLVWKDIEPTDGVFNWSKLDNALASGKNVWIRFRASDVVHCPAWLKTKYPDLKTFNYRWPGGGYNDAMGNTSPGNFYKIWDPRFEAEFKALLASFKSRHYGTNAKVRFAYIPHGWRWNEWSLKWVPEMAAEGTTPDAFIAFFNRMVDMYIDAFEGEAGKLVYTGTGRDEWVEYPGNDTAYNNWVSKINTADGGNVFSKYCLQKGCGVRDGFTELYNEFSSVPDWGTSLTTSNGSRHSVVNESHPLISATNRFFGCENEDFEYLWGGGSADYHHYKMATLLSLKLRMNWAFIADYQRAPAIFDYAAKTMGKHVNDSPDAWVALRQYRDPLGDSTENIRNYERWLIQRDLSPDGMTAPADLVSAPSDFVGQNSRSYEALSTKRASGSNYIYFGVDDRFIYGGTNNVQIKVTYLDNNTAKWSVQYDAADGNATKSTNTISNVNDGKWKTTTFTVADATFLNRQSGAMDFRIYNGGSADVTVRFVRVVKLTQPGTQPQIQKVATPSFTPNGGTFTAATAATLTCSTSGAQIRYTLDGSTPSATSAVYSSPIAVAQTATVKAAAYKSGMSDSDAASATFTVNIAGPLPPPWKNQDIGSVGLAGSAAFSNNTFTVKGAGADIWGSSDAFQFVYQPLDGDGEIVARVASLQKTSDWAKVGVMIRESLNANSKFVNMGLTPTFGSTFQRRLSTGGSSTSSGDTSVKAPYWVKAVRSGTKFSGYESSDGVNWKLVGTDSISMATTILVGMSVTAHNTTALNSATFDNVKVTAAQVEPPPTGTFSAKINFQPAAASVPLGYQTDSGATYGARSSGLTFGWLNAITSYTRDRNAGNSPDQRYDTFIHTQMSGSATWEIAVPNGSYTVRAIAGDPSYFDSSYKFNVEGVPTINAAPTKTQRWVEGTSTVTVSDGKLTLSNASGAINNKLAFVEISTAGAGAEGPDVALREMEQSSEVEMRELQVNKLAMDVNFAASGKESAAIEGWFSGLPNKETQNLAVEIDIAGAIVNFTLNSFGKAKSEHGTLQLKYDGNTERWNFRATLSHGDWKGAWADAGLTSNAAPSTDLNIPVTVSLGNRALGEMVSSFGGSKQVIYSVRANKRGRAK